MKYVSFMEYCMTTSDFKTIMGYNTIFKSRWRLKHCKKSAKVDDKTQKPRNIDYIYNNFYTIDVYQVSPVKWKNVSTHSKHAVAHLQKNVINYAQKT